MRDAVRFEFFVSVAQYIGCVCVCVCERERERVILHSLCIWNFYLYYINPIPSHS